jgi:uncharacterized membrane protein
MRIHILASVASAPLLLALPVQAQYTFTTLDVHCAATTVAEECPAGLVPGQVAFQTSARGINPQGDIVGSYVAVAGGRSRGFLLKGGRFTALEFPVPGVRATIANGINARGEIVGQYTVPVHDLANPPDEDSPLHCPSLADPACIKGFHYRNGRFTTVMFPTTVDENGQVRKHPGAIAQRITPEGDIYGCLHDHDTGASMFGAAWTRSGTFSLIYDGGQVADGMATPMSMNNGATPGKGRTTVGLFVDMANRQHGYLVRAGMLEPYDATPDADLTAIWDINPRGQFVGTYRIAGEPPARRHGFVQAPDAAQSTTLDFTCQDPAGCAGTPMGAVAFATIAFGINAYGIVVGQYVAVSGGTLHGFVATPSARQEF